MRQSSETLWPETEGGMGGTRNESGDVERSRGIVVGVCTLHLLSVEDGTSFGNRPIDGAGSRL